jgi:hypothetical protein
VAHADDLQNRIGGPHHGSAWRWWMKKRMVGQILIGTGLLFAVVGLVLLKTGQPVLVSAALGGVGMMDLLVGGVFLARG